MGLVKAALALSVGTVLCLTLAVPRLYTGIQEREVRRELMAATEGDTLDRKIDAAVAEGDIDGATQYADLAAELGRPLEPSTVASLQEAQEPLNAFLRNAGDFAGAYITGRADSGAGLAGAVVSDLTVVGDVRDIIREGGKAAVGEDYSQFLLALAAIGLAAEGATIATGGSSLVVKVGLSVLKVAKRTGNLTAAYSARLLRLAQAMTESATATSRTATTAAQTAGRTAGTAADATRAATPAPLTRTAARAELTTALGAVNTMAKNAGPANAVRLLRGVKTTRDAQEVATFTTRFGRRSRVVAELTGKTALRAFRVSLKGIKLLIAFLWSFLAWLGGLFALRIVRGTIGYVGEAIRATFFTMALPAR